MKLVPPGSIRVAPVCVVPPLLDHFEVDGRAVLMAANLDPQIFINLENVISLGDIGRLLRHCVWATQCSHFGLLVGQRCNLATIGLVGSLARQAPNVGSALRDLSRYLHVFNRASAISLAIDGDVATLGYAIVADDVAASDQISDACIAILFNTMRDLYGAGWSPTAIRLPHRAPPDARPFRVFFRTRVEFDAAEAALEFPAEWLRRPIAGSSSVQSERIMQRVSAIDAGSDRSVGEIVRRQLRASLPRGLLSEGDVAGRLAMDTSTLRRRLGREGQSFRAIAEAVRFETAKYFLIDSRLNLASIAEFLGYSEHSAFTRAFRKWSGLSPNDWRRANLSELGTELQ
jgi:AraC-like DNA-binding protein